jgi:ADP-L-glycero-D-manno-heptose 6-epimerase
MIVVTGGAGFIGSNLVHELNRLGETDILVVDNLAPHPRLSGPKFLNLTGARFADFMDKTEFRHAMSKGAIPSSRIQAVLHQGACSNTLEDDGCYMMDNNFSYSKELLEFSLANRIPFIYASSAAVYGASETFKEEPVNERPLNMYAFSKLAFDNYVRRRITLTDSTVVGLRYFNVYGPREQHKGRMASVIHQVTLQLKQTGAIRLFEGSGKYGDGEQRRDFIFVGDVVKINLFFLRGSVRHGIVNAGTGQSKSFNDVACALKQIHGKGNVEYIPFPDGLKDRYQNFTEADITNLRAMGYSEPLASLPEGIKQMVR